MNSQINKIIIADQKTCCEYCGKDLLNLRSLSFHRCKSRQNYNIHIKQNKKNEIIELYEYGEAPEYIPEKLNLKITGVTIRSWLKEWKVYQTSGVRFVFNENARKNKSQKTQNTCMKKYGVVNYGATQQHKNRLICSNSEKLNPFASEEFGWLEFIKGKRVLQKDNEEFAVYRDEAYRLTKITAKKLMKTNICYYTGLPIFHEKKFHYNMMLYATIDHKISILNGFLDNISLDVIANINNLCYCSRLVNMIKKQQNEEDFVNSVYFKRIMQLKPTILEKISNNES